MIFRTIAALAISVLATGPVWAGGTLAFALDNDIPFNTDREYTNGGVFTYTDDVNQGPNFIKSFLTNTLSSQDFQVHYSLGQWIFTPEDKLATEPLPDQRPYVGLMYGELGATFVKADLVHRLSFVLGVFGPPSFADEFQNFVHDVRGFDNVLGWNNQVSFEPALNVHYDVAKSITLAGSQAGLAFVVEPYAGVSVGNVTTNIRGGFTLRFGPDLNGQPAAPANRPGLDAPRLFVPKKTFRWHLYGTLTGRAEAYSTTIDGNIFRDSLSANRKALQWSSRMGFIASVGRYWFGGGVALTSRKHDLQIKYTHKVLETRLGLSFF